MHIWHADIHACIHTYMHVFIQAHTNTHKHSHRHIHTQIHTSIHKQLYPHTTKKHTIITKSLLCRQLKISSVLTFYTRRLEIPSPLPTLHSHINAFSLRTMLKIDPSQQTTWQPSTQPSPFPFPSRRNRGRGPASLLLCIAGNQRMTDCLGQTSLSLQASV